MFNAKVQISFNYISKKNYKSANFKWPAMYSYKNQNN